MIRIRQIKIPVEKDNFNYLKRKVSLTLKCQEDDIKKISISKKSLDARKKPTLFYIYEVDIDTKKEEYLLKKHKLNRDVFSTPNEEYIYPKIGNKKLENNPIIVGSGPAGLFCAYLLAELGYKPMIIERGEKIDIFFLDPPYKKGLYERCFELIREFDLLAEEGIIIAEHNVRDKLAEDLSGFEIIKERSYGTVAISIYGWLQLFNVVK